MYATTNVVKGAQELNFGRINGMLLCYKGCMYGGAHFIWYVLQVQMTHTHTRYRTVSIHKSTVTQEKDKGFHVKTIEDQSYLTVPVPD
jgi:hypothetical protein